MKDAIYNRFKKELSNYHKRGYSMNYPNSEAQYDEENGETVIFTQFSMAVNTDELTFW